MKKDRDFKPKNKFSTKKVIKKKYSKKTEKKAPVEPMRLNKFIAHAGVCSRRDADELIKKGFVKVNNKVVLELGTKIIDSDVVKLQDRVLQNKSKVYVLMNKPKNVITSVKDEAGRMTVIDIIRNKVTERIYPVGRLDKNTTGVLLLTNDGDITKKLTHPSFKKKKIYHATLDKSVTKTDIEKLAIGLDLEDGFMKFDIVNYVSNVDKNEIGLEIHSGRKRIVRRMFEALGYEVVKLDRVYFGGLTKKGLKRGRWRYLSDKEIGMLKMGSFR